LIISAGLMLKQLTRPNSSPKACQSEKIPVFNL